MENLNKINTYLKKLQKNFKNKISNLQINNNNLEQSNFFIRSLTWGLIASSGLTIFWLALAYTEEIVIVRGKLEPIGEVKEIQIPLSGVVKDILVKSGEIVSEGQVLLVLDNQIFQENSNSLKKQIVQTNMELDFKKKEKNKTLELFTKRAETLLYNLKIEKNILKRFENLFQEGAISELNYLRKLKEINSLEGEIAALDINLKRDDFKLFQEIKRIESNLSELKAKSIEAQVLLGYKSIKSPVDGMVFDLKATNIGFVAQSNSPIMKIVPFNNLEADVSIPSSKIGFIKVGMPVDISVDSFPANDFAPLIGIIESIGSDVIIAENTNPQGEFFYPARIKLKSQTLSLSNGDELPLQVGMSLRANIKLRKVSYLKLLLGSFREKTESLQSI